MCYAVYLRLLWGSLGAVQWGSHLGSVSSVSSVLLEAGWLAGSGGSARSLISITSRRRRCCCCYCLLCRPSTLLSSYSSSFSSSVLILCPTSAVEPVIRTHLFYCNSPSVSIYPRISSHLPALLFLSPLFLNLICTYRAVADRQTVLALLWMASSCTSGGSVRSSVALQTVSIVLRMTHSTLQRMAVSQTVRRTDSTAQTDRLVCRAYRQTAQERQAERQIVCDRYSQQRTESDNLPIQKRPASSGYRHRMKDRRVTYTDRQQRVCHLCLQSEYDIFCFAKWLSRKLR